MKASNSKEDARTVGYEGGKIHCLWRALEQGLFPFMMNEVGELTEKNKVFVAVCHALLNGMPGNGHETQRRPRRVASLVIPFGGILCYKHWKMAFFCYGTMPLHASTDAEHEFMNCLVPLWISQIFRINGNGRRCRLPFRFRHCAELSTCNGLLHHAAVHAGLATMSAAAAVLLLGNVGDHAVGREQEAGD